jgi:hypothetical protein
MELIVLLHAIGIEPLLVAPSDKRVHQSILGVRSAFHRVVLCEEGIILEQPGLEGLQKIQVVLLCVGLVIAALSISAGFQVRRGQQAGRVTHNLAIHCPIRIVSTEPIVLCSSSAQNSSSRDA